MSVINSMLKDLDKRQQLHDLENLHTAQVQFQPRSASKLPWILLAIVSVLLLCAIVYTWLALPNAHSEQAKSAASVSMQDASSADKLTSGLETESVRVVTSGDSPDAWILETQATGAEHLQVADGDVTPMSLSEPEDVSRGGQADVAVGSTATDITNVSTTPQAAKPQAANPVTAGAIMPRPAAANLVKDQPTKANPVTANVAKPQAANPVTVNAAKPSSMAVTEVHVSNEQLAQKRYRQAIEAENQGLLNDAISYYREALLLTPVMHKARRKLAALYYGQSRLDLASDILIQGFALFPEKNDYVFLLARVQQASGDIKLAMSSLEQIPDESLLAKQKWTMQSSLAQKSGNYLLAEASYRKLLRLEASQARWWMGLGYALDSQLKYDAAKQAYRQAMSADGLSKQANEYIESRLVQLGESE